MDAQDRYAAPESPEPPREEPPPWSLWLLYLLARPKLFFESFVIVSVPALTVLTTWLFGIASTMDRIETRSLTRPDSPVFGFLRQSWSVYWLGCAALGVVSGAMVYFVGGWWYRVRLRWSGAGAAEAGLARRVYIYASQAYAVPCLLYTAWETWRYPTPLAASAGDDIGGLLLVLAVFWSVYVSYRGVRTAFDVRKWAARLWFLILPGLLYGVFIGGAMVVGAMAAWMLEPPPELGRTVILEREAFRLEYPGNWLVNTEDEDYDPDLSFSIAPGMADAAIRFWFYGETMDSADCVQETLVNFRAGYELGPMEPIDSWGGYAGAGHSGTGRIEGIEFAVLMFCSSDDVPAFEVLQIVERAAVPRVSPGFDLIRDNLALRGR